MNRPSAKFWMMDVRNSRWLSFKIQWLYDLHGPIFERKLTIKMYDMNLPMIHFWLSDANTHFWDKNNAVISGQVLIFTRGVSFNCLGKETRSRRNSNIWDPKNYQLSKHNSYNVNVVFKSQSQKANIKADKPTLSLWIVMKDYFLFDFQRHFSEVIRQQYNAISKRIKQTIF